VTENIEEAEIRVLTEGELISAVVEKHKRFLEENRKEFGELDCMLSQVEEDVKNAKNSRIRMEERKEVLKEKRQQFYHQAEALLEKDVFQKLDPITISKLKEELKKLKGQIEPEEEQKLKDSFMGNLREIVRASGLGENIILQTGARMEEARNSNLELKEIIQSEKQLVADDGSKSEEISKSKSQHKWLSTRIKNHEDALNYWEKLKV
jgi:glycerol-3-phosphate cytidylyltransferase-like family protein